MDDAIAPAPIDKPDILVSDAGPFIHLAAGLLHRLHEGGASAHFWMYAQATFDLEEMQAASGDAFSRVERFVPAAD
ncbi:MAG: hypothetical protein ACRYGP_27425 [Janthinobacterium lividum]